MYAMFTSQILQNRMQESLCKDDISTFHHRADPATVAPWKF